MSRGGIVFVHPADELYGADRVLLEVLSAVPDDVPVQVWLPRDIDYPEKALSSALAARGIPVQHRDLPVLRRSYLHPLRVWPLLPRLLVTALAMLRARPDLVYLNTSACLPIAPLGRLVGAPVLLHLHEAWSGPERTVLGVFGRSCQQVIAVSAAVRDLLPAALRSRTVVLHNGFAEVPEAAPAALPASAAGRLVLLLASRWNGWKGHRELLAAWGRVTRRDVALVVLGGPPPSGERVDVPALVAELPNAASVHVVGEVSDTGPWLAACDVVVVPSVQPDPLPTIALEAAGAGKAVLASDLGGLPEIIDDGRTGRLLPAGDAAAWSAAVDALDPAEVRRWGAAARELFVDRFGVARFHDQIAAVLAHWLTSRRS